MPSFMGFEWEWPWVKARRQAMLEAERRRGEEAARKLEAEVKRRAEQQASMDWSPKPVQTDSRGAGGSTGG